MFYFIIKEKEANYTPWGKATTGYSLRTGVEADKKRHRKDKLL